jgi:hypothetical protein
MKILLTASLVVLSLLTLDARHHNVGDLSVASPRCGWIEGENVRDFSNLEEFCARWVPAGFRIRAASATRERLWIEAPSEVVATLRSGEPTTRALLKQWLDQWRTITGYRTAFVVLLQGHHEIARAQTTLTGDFVSIR